MQVTLRANVALNTNAIITLTNLRGINEVTKEMAIAGADGVFKANVNGNHNFAMWDAELHKLTMVAVAPIDAGTRTVFNITIKNPCCVQPSPVVCIKASRINGACAACNPDTPGQMCGDSECGQCISISRQVHKSSRPHALINTKTCLVLLMFLLLRACTHKHTCIRNTHAPTYLHTGKCWIEIF